jgi:hypothetical protein
MNSEDPPNCYYRFWIPYDEFTENGDIVELIKYNIHVHKMIKSYLINPDFNGTWGLIEFTQPIQKAAAREIIKGVCILSEVVAHGTSNILAKFDLRHCGGIFTTKHQKKCKFVKDFTMKDILKQHEAEERALNSSIILDENNFS